MAQFGVTGRLVRSIIAGVLCAVVSVPIAYLALDRYVVLTISVGDTRLIARLIRAALVVVGLTSFCSGFVSQYFSSASATA